MTVSIINKYIKQYHLIPGIKSEYQREKKKIDEGKQKFSKSLHTIDKREGYRLIIINKKRKLQPSELLKADKVSNPISQANVDRTIKSKENSKITNKLIIDENMTKQEALKAKKKLKENSLPSALSIRSNYRVLRSNK